MPSSKPNILVRFLRFIWRAISWLRIGLLNLIFIAFLVIFVSAIMESAPKPIERAGPLFLAPSGTLVDQLSYEPPLATLSGSNKAPETLTTSLIETILNAANDERITGLIIKLDDLGGGGISKINEVGQAIEAFKAQDKPVVAYANAFGQSQYLLASYADTIYMHDMGRVAVTGFGLYRNYFKGLIEKLGINIHVFKSGTFKDFVEPYIREDMSLASREHNQYWVNALWKSYSSSIEQRRNIEPGALDNYIHNIGSLMAEHNGDTATLALQSKLVDHTGSKQTIINALIKQFGSAKKNPEVFHYIAAADYQQELYLQKLQQTGNIGLIVASGSIVDGEQPEGSIGGDTLVQLIRKARKNKDIQAIVIRVDSGGGSAFASELIRQEIAETRSLGKPVFISMGGMAASGGYWLATAADEIWATPATLTGSIGVFSIIPTFENSLSKIGVSNDGFATSKMAGALRLERAMAPEVEQVFQMGVDSIYQKFLTLCAEGRDKSIEDIKAVAEGRVWLGSQALEHGLVDHLGSLQDTIRAAAKHASIGNPSVVLIERDLSPIEQLMKNLMLNAEVFSDQPLFDSSASAALLGGIDKQLSKEPLIHILQQEIQKELPNSTPTIYATCTDCNIH